MKEVTIKFDYEDATILAYAKRRGFVEEFVKDENGNDTQILVVQPIDFLKQMWRNYIMTNINEFLEDQVWSSAESTLSSLKADADSKLTIE
jgi:hypothetical protein